MKCEGRTRCLNDAVVRYDNFDLCVRCAQRRIGRDEVWRNKQQYALRRLRYKIRAAKVRLAELKKGK